MILALAFFSGGKSAFLLPINRMLSISTTDTTTNTRILAAKSSWEGFLERPIWAGDRKITTSFLINTTIRKSIRWKIGLTTPTALF